MASQESNIDRLLQARAEIDERLRRHKSATTILFTDVVGSTAYFDRYGDTAGFALLHRQSDLAGTTFASFNGRVIKTIGDSVMADFSDPASAVRAAMELQRRLRELNHSLPERERLEVRIGINHGVGFRSSADVYGDVVNIAARITKRTGPAQILISGHVYDNLSDTTLQCRSLGKVALAGKGEKEEIYEVIWTDSATYTDLRRALTRSFERGEIIAPGTHPGDLIAPDVTPAIAGQGSVAVAPAPLTAPTIPRYDVLEMLGSGGMGVVYKARDRETHEIVALKVLRPDIAADTAAMDRFKNELRLARRVTHRNVCRIHEFGRTDSVAYISMEYVDGENLRAALNRFGGLPVRKAVTLARQICAGLREAHAQGIVHRDLKPENVMLDRAGNVKIMDFGIARSTDLTGRLTGGLIGTPAYMAPEQAEGKAVDARSDIYAVGLILYEMFTGAPAFSGDTPVAIALKHIREAPRSPRELEPGLPEDIEEIILRCLEKDAAARFQSVAQLEEVLPPAREDSSASVAASPRPARTPLARPIRRRRYLWIAVVLLALGVAGATVFLWPDRKPPASPPDQQTTTATPGRPAVPQSEADQWLERGNAFYQKGEYEDAINAFQAALLLDSTNKLAKSGLNDARSAMATEWRIMRDLNQRAKGGNR